MSLTKKFSIKLGIYVAFLLYLVGDLFVWDGYFYTTIHSYQKAIPPQPGDKSPIVVEVYGEPITQNQINRRKSELTFLRTPPVIDLGANSSMLIEQSEKDLLTRAKYDLILASLLRLKTRVNDAQLPNRNKEAAHYERGIATRFDSDREAYLAALYKQRQNPSKFRDQITARLKQHDHLERTTATAADPSEKELQACYNLIKDKLKSPSQREVSHIFLATLHKDANSVYSTAQSILRRLEAGEAFASLAREFSEDLRSAHEGGHLGFINPLTAKNTLGLDLSSIPANTPTIAKSNWGYHIILASSLKEGSIPTYEQAKPQLKSALHSIRKAKAVSLYMDSVLEEAHLRSRVKHAKTRTR